MTGMDSQLLLGNQDQAEPSEIRRTEPAPLRFKLTEKPPTPLQTPLRTMRINEVDGDSGWRISGYRTRIGAVGKTKQKERRMFLVLPISKLAEHDLIDGIVCPNSSHTLYKRRLVYIPMAARQARIGFSTGFTKTEHCCVFMYVTNADDHILQPNLAWSWERAAGIVTLCPATHRVFVTIGRHVGASYCHAKTAQAE
jgi:hypothetical protein